MPDVSSWGWYVSSPWPGYNASSDNNLDAIGDGLVVDTSGYVDVTLRDANGDGIIYDQDGGDGSVTDPGEELIGPNLTLIPEEVALYTGSTMTIYGITYDVRLQVTLFADGSYSVRLMDSDIPPGHARDVTFLQLGTWNGVEYSGVSLAAVDAPFVCFEASTQIKTLEGHVPVSELRAGDLVWTLDHGYRPLIWVGHSIGKGHGRRAPVVFFDDATGEQALVVSQQHRMLVEGPEVLRQSKGDQAMVAAKHMVNNDTVRIVPRDRMHYVHLLCDRHEVVLANGLLSETLYPGPQAIDTMGQQARADFTRRFPSMVAQIQQGNRVYAPARPFLTGPMVKIAGARSKFELVPWAIDLPQISGQPLLQSAPCQ